MLTATANDFSGTTPASCPNCPCCSCLGLLSTTLPGTVGLFSSGWPVAYLIATVICGVSLLIGSLVPCVPARTGRQAIVSAQPGGCRAEDGACRQDHRHGRLQVGWHCF